MSDIAPELQLIDIGQLRAIAAINATPMTVGSADGHYLVVNEPFAVLTGRSVDELTGLPFAAITVAEDHEAGLGALADATTAGTPGLTFDKRYIRPDGRIVHARLSTTIVRGPANEVLCFVTQATDLTELREAQQESQRNEERVRRVISSATDAYVSIDHLRRVRDWNPAAVRMFGWSREEAIGADLAELIIPPDLRGAHRDGVERYLASQEPRIVGTTVEQRAVRKDGVELPVDLTLWAATETDGELSFHAFLRDASVRVRAAEEARRHALVLSALTDGVVLTNDVGTIIDTNPAAERLFGRTRDEIIGVAPTSMLDITQEQIDSVRGLVAEHGSWSGDLAFTLPDGGRRTSEATVKLVTGPNGEPEGFLAVHRDVTNDRAAQARLNQSEARYRLLAENSSDVISHSTVDGTLVYVSPSYQKVFGLEPDYRRGGPMAADAHPDDAPAVRKAWQSVLRGTPARITFRGRRGDDSWVWLESISEPMRDPQTGAVVGVQTATRDITERRLAEAELERMALSDALTGLANRTLLTDRLRLAQQRLRRDPGNVALLMLDLDRFKLVNDTLGHSVGDAMLIEVAQRLQRCARPTDTVARLGGDEFIVLLDRLSDLAQAELIAERILASLRDPMSLAGLEPLEIRGSIGIAVSSDPDHPADSLYREADLALYQAKDQGRDRFSLFDAGLRQRVLAQVKAERQLRRALAEDRLHLFYQPIVRLADDSVSGSEALVRLQEPESTELVLPDEFIEAAEESGLIADLDQWVLTRAVEHLSAIGTVDGIGGSVAINISPRSMVDSRFAEKVADALSSRQIDPRRLLIEVTERTLMDTSGIAVRSLNLLRDLGVRVGIDDFGTGYSSLGYLQQLPLDFLKIDRSFIGSLTDSSRARATVEALTRLAHAHGLTVTAEGVETELQLAAVREIGCDFAQGYLTGRPSPA